MGDPLGYGVLGPLQVRHGTGELGIGPPQQRTVLAALLLREAAPASIDISVKDRAT